MLENQIEKNVKPLTVEKVSVSNPFNVVLFNDDIHTFDEVIIQLIKAVNCSFIEARSYAFEVHVKGKALIFGGDLPSCLKVTSILEEIELHTQIISK